MDISSLENPSSSSFKVSHASDVSVRYRTVQHQQLSFHMIRESHTACYEYINRDTWCGNVVIASPLLQTAVGYLSHALRAWKLFTDKGQRFRPPQGRAPSLLLSWDSDPFSQADMTHIIPTACIRVPADWIPRLISQLRRGKSSQWNLLWFACTSFKVFETGASLCLQLECYAGSVLQKSIK